MRPTSSLPLTATVAACLISLSSSFTRTSLPASISLRPAFYRTQCESCTPNGRIASSRRRAAVFSEDDEIAEPLAEGVDSVSWLPTVSGAKGGLIEGSSAKEGSEIMPLFPLGGIVYTPNSNHVLNIFEPRYRQMYNDILMNGSKRFVVSMSHPEETGRFAEIGVVFQLEDLKEVSEQTNDQVKYVCTHRVTGRVKIDRVLNPQAWASRDTYLKIEGRLLEDEVADDSDEPLAAVESSLDEGGPALKDVYSQLISAATGGKGDMSTEETDLATSFHDLVELQHELSEDVRFTRSSVQTLGVKPNGGEDSLWATIRLWQSYTEQRLVARQNELQKEFQEKLLKYLMKDKGVTEDELPSAIGFADLSPALQKEVQDLQKRMAVELQPLVLESTLTMQKILEANNHATRVNLVRYFIDAERKRLKARKLLQGMFQDSPKFDDMLAAMEKEDREDEMVLLEEDEVLLSDAEEMVMLEDAIMDVVEEAQSAGKRAEAGGGSGTIFLDDEDAFQ